MSDSTSVKIEPRKTLLLYLVIMFCYFACHIDGGVISSSNESIKKELGFSDTQIGLTATGLYIGDLLGCLLCPFLFSRFKTKYVIIIASVLNGAFVMVFTLVNDFTAIFISRIFTGMAHVIFVVYFPVWID
jgi:predicted MFS family arabinose efflux permease